MGQSSHNFFSSNRKLILTVSCALLLGLALGIALARIFLHSPDVFVSAVPPAQILKPASDLENKYNSLGRENAQLKDRLAKAEEMAQILKQANSNLEANIMDLQNDLVATKNKPPIEEELAPGYDMCMSKTDGVTLKILDCMNDANEYIDKRLNFAYNKLLKACDYPGNDVRSCTAKIKTMELNWIRFRDAATDIMALVDFKGLGEGTMYRVISFEFYVNESKKHLEKLNNMLNNIQRD